MAKRTTMSGRDEVGETCAHGLKPLVGWEGELSTP